MHSGSAEIEVLERRFIREVVGQMSHAELLDLLEGLWLQAMRMRPDFPEPWEDDLAPDLELARVLNAVPSR